MNRLISIGYLGGIRCYLNVSMEEAKQRYQREQGEDPEDMTIREFEFEDVFSAYDIWEEVEGDPCTPSEPQPRPHIETWAEAITGAKDV